MKPKLLIVELWGLGDLVMATGFIRAASASYDVYLLGKAHASALLKATFPELHFLSFDAPWTKFEGKYRLWQWPWRRIFSLVAQLRRERFDVAVSVRRDPRDHLLLWLSGAQRRVSLRHRGGRIFLTDPVARNSIQHRVQDWRTFAEVLEVDRSLEPILSSQVRNLESAEAPTIMLHTGARIAVRRWPEAYFADIITRLRQEYNFRLTLVPDPDGYGRALEPLADSVLTDLSLTDLIDHTAKACLLICNDSGPMHIAAALGIPTLAVFGPTEPRIYGPWGKHHRILVRDLCAFRPCFDYCRFPEPYCLTQLKPEMIWPEIVEHLSDLLVQGVLPERFAKQAPVLVPP